MRISALLSVVGWDVLLDARDFVGSLANFAPKDLSWWGNVALNLVALIPVIGVLKPVIKGFKHLDEVAGVVKYSDEVADSAKYLDEAVEVGRALSKPSSKILRQNLIEAGMEVPNYPNAAHHIVAGNSPKAAEARAILQKYGVDINDAANGTFLPIVKEVVDGAYHPSLHTNAYYDRVNKLLSEATSKEDVLDILEFIGDELSSGTFMQ